MRTAAVAAHQALPSVGRSGSPGAVGRSPQQPPELQAASDVPATLEIQAGNIDRRRGDDRLHMVALDQPDVAIVDIRIPLTHTDEGLVAARCIRERYPKTSAVLLSQYLEPRCAQWLLAD